MDKMRRGTNPPPPSGLVKPPPPAGPSKWAWLPAAMPGVARLMAEKRQLYGNAHVNACWQRGVVEQQPGWLFAREGGLAIGMPWAEFADVALWQLTVGQVTFIMKTPEAPNAAH